jgi:hypothetical protein
MDHFTYDAFCPLTPFPISKSENFKSLNLCTEDAADNSYWLRGQWRGIMRGQWTGIMRGQWTGIMRGQWTEIMRGQWTEIMRGQWTGIMRGQWTGIMRAGIHLSNSIKSAHFRVLF